MIGKSRPQFNRQVETAPRQRPQLNMDMLEEDDEDVPDFAAELEDMQDD